LDSGAGTGVVGEVGVPEKQELNTEDTEDAEELLRDPVSVLRWVFALSFSSVFCRSDFLNKSLANFARGCVTLAADCCLRCGTRQRPWGNPFVPGGTGEWASR
jgi:hypothetical protein